MLTTTRLDRIYTEMDESKEPFKIDVNALNWRAAAFTNDPTDCLLATLVIGGTSMHLEAFAVTEEAGGSISASAGTYETDVETICEAVNKKPMITTIEGREYVLRALPYQR